MALLHGASVITAVSNETKAEHARSAGATEIINYRTGEVRTRIKAITAGRGVDAVIEVDLSSNARSYPEILRPHGTVVVYGMSLNGSNLPSLWLMQNSITLKLFLVYAMSERDRSAAIVELLGLLD